MVSPGSATCPITSALTDWPDNVAFRELSRHLFDGWIAEFEHHAIRFGASAEEARRKAEHCFILLQGGWDLARSRQDSDVLRHLPLPD